LRFSLSDRDNDPTIAANCPSRVYATAAAPATNA
jgi:hypothetical protein